MSACDEGWGEAPGDNYYAPQCPCLDTYADAEQTAWCCNLGVFKRHDQYLDDPWRANDLRPGSCPHVETLKRMRGWKT